MQRPLVLVASGLAIGIFLVETLGIGLALLLLVGIGLILWWRQQEWRRSFIVLLAALIGAVWLFIRMPVWPAVSEACWTEMHVLSVETKPRSTQATVAIKSMDGLRMPAWNPARAQLTLPLTAVCEPGDNLAGRVDWRLPAVPLNPGEFDYAAYLRRQGILATGFVADSGQIERTAFAGRGWVWAGRDKLLRRAAELEGVAGELLATLALGARPGDWAEAWRQTGLAHLLAISGLHIGLVLMAGRRLLLGLGCQEKVANLATAVLIVLYGWIIGPKPAVWRAIIMALLALLALATQRLQDWPNAIAAAAILLLLYNPWLLWDAGFQLSFAATLGLLSFAPRLQQHLPPLPWNLDWLLSASLAAQLFTFPLVLHHFYLITPLALVFNVALAPVLPVALLGGLAYLLLPFLGGLLVPPLRMVLMGMQRLVEWFAVWPLSSFSPGVPPLWLLACYIFLLLFMVLQRQRHTVVMVAFILVLTLSLIWQPLVRYLGNSYWLSCLSVGQGAASVLHLPGGEAVLFDVGGGYDGVGRQVIVPYLRYRGVWRLSAIYISHLHDDHIAGLEDVLAAFPVQAIYLPVTSLETEAYSRLAPLLQQHNVSVYSLGRGAVQRQRAMQIEVLNPPPGPPQDENEDSLVLLLRWPNLSVLLPGDIGSREQDLLPYLPSSVDILLVPHHGSNNSSSESFLQILRPEHAIISTGPNRYGHPGEAAWRRLQRHSRFVWRTDQAGAVTLVNSHRGWRLFTFLPVD